MNFPVTDTSAFRTTNHKVVLPFYLYASVSFFLASLLLVTSQSGYYDQHFNPFMLAVTHTMALGWATMIIIGASHQLVPVLIEGGLYSERLAILSFLSAALGIPLLVFGFYTFSFGLPSKIGAILIVIAVLCYVVNMLTSIAKSGKMNIHAVFILTASLWLFFTVSLGLLLIYNFSRPVLPEESIHYLGLHAYAGISGWFLLLVTGVGSRLIPMFLISKYSNTPLLWAIYILINSALVLLLFKYFVGGAALDLRFPVVFVLLGVALFLYYCIQSFRKRLRRLVDDQMKASLFSVLALLSAVLILLIITGKVFLSENDHNELILLFGFLVFFGWLTAIILGMTFKTLPFIVWNRIYKGKSSRGGTPSPKELFSESVNRAMYLFFISGILVFSWGILGEDIQTIRIGAVLLLLTSFLYNFNVFKIIYHKAVDS